MLLPSALRNVCLLRSMPVSGAATERNSLRQGIFSVRRRNLSAFSIRDRDLEIVRPVSRGWNREPDRPEQGQSNAKQGIEYAEQGIKNAYRRASSCADNGAVCN